MALSRAEFFARVGLLKEIDPLTESAYSFIADQESKKSDQGASVADKWHVSFHGSQFPGDDPYACGRKAIYRMMDVGRGSTSRFLQQLSEAGKDIEERIVGAWWRAGYLISPPPHEHQKQYEDPEAWLTSTVDSVVLIPRSNKPIVVEVKTKFAEAIEDMRRLIRGPDEAHLRQIKCQIGLVNEAGPTTVLRCQNTDRVAVTIKALAGDEEITVCPQHMHADCLYQCELEAPDYGFLYYVSRDNPIDTWEFFVDYDARFMKEGRAQLKEWKAWWESGRLPQTVFDDKRFSHPFGWQWSKDQYPCKFCDYGDYCRKDHKQAIKRNEPIMLEDSEAVHEMQYLRPDYDLDLVRAAIENRWDRAKINGSPATTTRRSRKNAG